MVNVLSANSLLMQTTVLQDKSMVVTFDESDEEEDAATLAERLYSGSGGL